MSRVRLSILSILSFVKGREGFTPFGGDVEEIIRKISNAPYESFSFSLEGVDITCDVDYSGYFQATGVGILWPEDDQEHRFSFSFSMQKI